MAKYLSDVAGVLTEVAGIAVSAGAGDASKFPQTDSTGRLDISFMPVGVGAEVTVAPSSENLTAGNFVNIYNNASALNVRKADATTSAKPAQGFVLATVTSPANATVYRLSQTNTQQASMTIGAIQYLATTPGTRTETAPQASGNIVQKLGTADSATSVVFDNCIFWVKA